jgi:hypothetical protein
VKIVSNGLTTCGVLKNGQGITLGLLDESGDEITLQLSFDHAQAIVMTLPGLLTLALRSLTGEDSARYVFALNAWVIEQSNDRNGLVLTLGTPDGFKISFNIPVDACRSLGGTLTRECGPSAESDEAAGEEWRLRSPIEFN